MEGGVKDLESLLAKREFVFAQFVKHFHRGDIERARFYMELIKRLS